VQGTSGRTLAFTAKTVLTFTIGGKTGHISIDTKGMSIQYSCEFDGTPIPEENSILNGGATAADETHNRLKVTVESGDVGVRRSLSVKMNLLPTTSSLAD
jgi:hypothetical protein